MSDFADKAEEEQLFRKATNNTNPKFIFEARLSAGRNPQKLAQILTAFDFAMHLLGWQDKPLANLTNFLVNYQASVDAKYHNDFKDISIAEEIERRRSERKGISILQSNK